MKHLREKLCQDPFFKTSCPICTKSLESRSFDPEELCRRFEDALKEDAAQEANQPEEADEERPEPLPLEDGEAPGANIPQQQQDQDEVDPFRYARKFEAYMDLLEPGSHGKRYPMRCRLCKSRKSPQGKIFELSEPRHRCVKHFIDQHVDGVIHVQNLANIQEIPDQPMPEVHQVPCEGFCLEDESKGSLKECTLEFQLWTSFSNFQRYARRKYWQDATSNTWFIRAQSCTKECVQPPGQRRPMCNECFKLSTSKGICKTVMKFAQKHFAATLLNARLFQGIEAANEIIAKMKETRTYMRDPSTVGNLIELAPAKLQQFVRYSWLSCNEESMTEIQRSFIASVVTPCLRVKLDSVPACLTEVVSELSRCIATGSATDSEMARIKVACGAINGTLEEHPLLHGLSLQCLRLNDKRSRGIETMAGRRSNESAFESALIADAGMRLAMAAGNKDLAREFGIPASSMRTALDDLPKMSLPFPALALMWPDALKENRRIIDQRYVIRRGAEQDPPRILDYKWMQAQQGNFYKMEDLF